MSLSSAPATGRQDFPRRSTPLDGLRGIVIVLVVLNHATGALWAREPLTEFPLVNGLFGGGAVVIFFVVGAFIVAQGLLAELARGRFDPFRFYLRRLVRLGVQLVPLCVALWLYWRLVLPNEVSIQAQGRNLSAVLTNTLNWLAKIDFFIVRPEVGHLWYVSLMQQCYLVLPLVIVFAARFRIFAVLALLVGMVGVFLARQIVLQDDGWVLASQLTYTRSDGLLWGVALALMLPWLSRFHSVWPMLGAASASALLVLQFALPWLSDYAFLGPWSVAYTLVSGLLVVVLWQLAPTSLLARAFSQRTIVWLGRASLPIYVWHLPIILVISRHTPNWHWLEKSIAAFVLTAAVVFLMEQWVEQPTRRWLRTSPVFRGKPVESK